MGADGHIRIHDLKKAKEILKDNPLNKVLLKDSMTYQHKLTTPSGEECHLLTRYWGDNIWYQDLWDFLTIDWNGVDVQEVRDNYSYETQNISDEAIIEAQKLVKRIEAEATLAYDWEIWT